MQFSIMEYVTIVMLEYVTILRDIYNYLFIKLYIVSLIYLQFSKNSRNDIFLFFFFLKIENGSTLYLFNGRKNRGEIRMLFTLRYFLVCELRERGEKTSTTALIKNIFVGFFVSTPPFSPLPPLSAPAVAVINGNFLIRIPTITPVARCPGTWRRVERTWWKNRDNDGRM